MSRETTSVSREDYLKAIWELEQGEQPLISARLAEELRVTPPAVTSALKRHDPRWLAAYRARRPHSLDTQGPRRGRAVGAAPPTRRKTADRCDRARLGREPTKRPSCSNTASPPRLQASFCCASVPIAPVRTVCPCAADWRGSGGRGVPCHCPIFLWGARWRSFVFTKKTPSSWNFSVADACVPECAFAFCAASTMRPPVCRSAAAKSTWESRPPPASGGAPFRCKL